MRGHGPALTEQEQRVATLVAKGYSTHEIAVELAISRRTATNHVSAVLAFMKRRAAHEAGDPPALSPREVEVAELVARGASDAEIAEALSISVRTAEDHVHRIIKKFGYRARHDIERGGK